jgi:nitroreductase
MSTVSGESILEQFRWRYATKKFDTTKKIPAQTWKQIEEAIVLSPSSYGLQPWKLLVVETPEIRAKLREASWNQPQITDASHLVVFCRRAHLDEAYVDRFVARVSEVRGAPVSALKGYRDMMAGSVNNPPGLPGGSMDTYTRSQTYIALGFALATAAMLGVDACPMEGFNPAKYDEILGLGNENLKASVVATFGYRAADDAMAPTSAKKVRHAHEHVVEHR